MATRSLEFVELLFKNIFHDFFLGGKRVVKGPFFVKSASTLLAASQQEHYKIVTITIGVYAV